MDNQAIVIIAGIAAVVLLAVVCAAAKALRARAAMREFLDHNRFLPCEEERAQLLQTAQALCQRSGATYEIKKVHKTSWNRKAVHYFTLSQFLGGDLSGTADAFLFPFRGGTDQPFILYLKPGAFAVPRAIEAVVLSLINLSDALRPDRLVRLELSDEMKSAGVLAAYAREATSLDSLLDPATLRLIVQSADYGCFGFHYGEGRALVTFMQDLRLPNMDLEQQWAHIRKLIEH